MKRILLSSAAIGVIATPVGAETPTPLMIGVEMASEATAHVTIDKATFVLPDEREAMSAALNARGDKHRPVTLVVTGKTAAPYRIIGGMIYLTQSAGFTQVTVATEPPVD
ncbi:hypothetical protein ACFQ15_11915 [Sphingomonas hankookensis]|uniref:hypothetical protein n=1 Tax=Sphingomonas hankookensis TaxID=563996 RepID=UPI001F588972|nr:hypothetical protein [Sphingomonas hankookensis]